MTSIFSVERPRQQLWLAALKPPMYSVAIIPITVGTAIAYGETGQFIPGRFGLFLGSAILIIAWLNLSNDVFDADTGIDVNKAHSVVNLTGKRSWVFGLSNVLLALGLAGIMAIAWEQQSATVLGLVALSCCLGYSYQGPPFRLGYLGLGEIICFICFGPLAIAAAYFAQVAAFSATSLAPASLIGITTSIILFCSHFHQVEDDLAAGKLSPIVRLGTLRGSQVLTGSIVSVFVLTLGFIALGWMPIASSLIALSSPIALQLVRHVRQFHDQPEQVSNCKFIAVNFHFVSGMLLALGYALSRWVS
jgi:1,4-dihydroxy-2-naphthoate octaprenyltransferase